MRRLMIIALVLTFPVAFALPFLVAAPAVQEVSDRQLDWIAQKIWLNECAGKIEGLTSWNEGEEFASMGIGHFIWFPAHAKPPFQETFPDLLVYMQSRGIAIPIWIAPGEGPPRESAQLSLRSSPCACPWASREEFMASQQDKKMLELRQFLYETRRLQAAFIVRRLAEAMPRLLANAPESDRKRIERQYVRLANEPMGLYAMLDYVNFKGEGAASKERYRGKGWGLLQVLLEMPEPAGHSTAIADFVATAGQVLERRVANSPPERREGRWLKGWRNRLNTYLEH